MALPKTGEGMLVVGGASGLQGEPPEPWSSGTDGCLEGGKEERKERCRKWRKNGKNKYMEKKTH